jgi:hypothetical protein
MKAWIVRFASLYVFDVVVLLLIGAFTPGVRVGWHAFWAAVILTAATIWLKPLVHRMFRSMASRSAPRRGWLAEKAVQYGLVLAVAAIVWVLVVVFTGVRVSGFFWLWGWVSPPIFLTIAWAVYDLVDDRVEASAGRLYDRATGRGASSDPLGSGYPGAAPAGYPGAAGAGTPPRRDDGLTDEQRRMLDELG